MFESRGTVFDGVIAGVIVGDDSADDNTAHDNTAQPSPLEIELDTLLWQAMADHTITPQIPISVIADVLAVDHGNLSPTARLAALRVTERALAMLSAVQHRLIADAERNESLSATEQQWATAHGGVIDQVAREHVAVALRISPRTASNRIHDALTFTEQLPELLDELSAGRISLQHARVISDETAILDRAQARAIAREVIPLAQRAAVSRVRRRTAQLVARANPTATTSEHAGEVPKRCVRLQPEPWGMATLSLYTDAITARRLYDTLTEHAHATPTASDETVDAKRADACARLILRASTSAEGNEQSVAPRIAVHVDLSALVGTSHTPGHVPGLGPIPAAAVRALATEAEWVRYLHLPTHTGSSLVAVDSHTYRPRESVAALVRARDVTCQFPHCAQPAHRCDLDHIEPFNHHDPSGGGPTTPDNLTALCRRHHRLKTAGQWSVRRTPDHTLNWVGPHSLSFESDVDPPF